MKSTVIVATMTLVSRLLGFARDIVIAHRFGADVATDAFFVAFRIPNLLRRLFAEGSFAQAFVPAIADRADSSDSTGLKGFLDRVSGSLALIFFAVTLLGVLAAPLLILAFAPGFLKQPEAWDLSIAMLRITFPYLWFVSLTAFAGSILNSSGHFAIPAFTPALLNLAMIAAAVWLAPRLPEPITALAWGVLLAGILQLGLQIPALCRAGLLPRPRAALGDPEVMTVLRRMPAAIFGISVTQVNLLVDTLLASLLASGAVSWLYYSDRLVEFPLGLFGVALGTAILPQLSRSHARQDPEGFSRALDWGLRWVVLIGLPSAVGLVILAEPLMSTLFQSEEFTAHDAQMAGRSLASFAIGLPGVIAMRVLAPGFSSRHDLAGPVRFGLLAMLANALLGAGLAFGLAPAGWEHAALALATGVAALFNAGLLLHGLLDRLIYRPQPGWGAYLARICAANLAMGALLIHWTRDLPWDLWTFRHRALGLTGWILGGGSAYLAALWLSGLRPRHLRLEA